MAIGAVLRIGLLGGGVLPVPAVTQLDLERLPPAEFEARPDVRRRIDPDNVDRDLLAAAIFHEANRVRRQLGLPQLQVDERANAAAGMQTSLCSFLGTSGQENPLSGLRWPLDRAKRAGLNPGLIAENVAQVPLLDLGDDGAVGITRGAGGSTFIDPRTEAAAEYFTYEGFARNVSRRWMQSPGHRANLVNPKLRFLGTSFSAGRGIAGAMLGYAVQLFHTPQTDSSDAKQPKRLR